MSNYLIYWPYSWVKLLFDNGDTGPLEVIYGGVHCSQPPLGKVGVGDVVFPVTLVNKQLFVLGRMTISEIIDAEDYTQTHVFANGKPFLWEEYNATHKHLIDHTIPRTHATHAAIGEDGASLAMRPFPAAALPYIKLGAKPGEENAIRLREGFPRPNIFAGYFRRMSEDTVCLFEEIVRESEKA